MIKITLGGLDTVALPLIALHPDKRKVKNARINRMYRPDIFKSLLNKIVNAKRY